MMRFFLELLRIILIFALLGSLIWLILHNIYSGIPAEQYDWLGALGIYVFLFVMYRNRWQFSGWYTGKGRQKLPQKVSEILLGIAILFVILPIILGFLIN